MIRRAFSLRMTFAASFLLLGTLAAVADCTDALATGQAYKTYRTILKKLEAGDDPGKIKNIECLVSGDIDGAGSAEVYYEIVSGFFNADVLYDYLVSQEKSVFRKYKEVESSANFAWRGGYLSEAALTAYERTGQRRFLDLFVGYFNKVLEMRDDVLGREDEFHQRVMKSWGEYRPVDTWLGLSEDQQWMAHITHAARIALAPAIFARLVAADPGLADYAPTAAAFVAAVKEALDEFDEDCIAFEGLGGCWYERPMTGGPEATNHIHTLGSVLIHFDALGGDPETAGEINRIVGVFERGVVTAEDGTVYWQYFPFFADQSIGPNGREYSERIWKASQTVPFIYRAYEAGYDVPEALVKAIVSTFLTHVVQGDQVLRNLSPTESAEVEADEEGGHLDGLVTWLELAAYEPEIADRVRHIFAARPDLFPGAWFGSTNSARGYAHFLGGESGAATTGALDDPERHAEKPRP